MHLNVCDAYDLRNRQWNQLSSLPKTVFNASLLNLNKICLIAGISNFMFTYNWKSDSYSEVAHNLTISSYSKLIKDNTRIHFFHINFVYLGNVDEINSWRKTPLIGTFNCNTCLPFIKGRLVYFADLNCQIYQYDLDSYRIDTIA